MKNLKEARTYSGFSQREIAHLVNISQQSYSDYENGKTFPDEYTLIALANHLGVSVDYLLGREDDFGNIIISTPIRTSTSSLTDEEQQLLDDYRSLTPALKKMINETIKTWKKSEINKTYKAEIS